MTAQTAPDAQAIDARYAFAQQLAREAGALARRYFAELDQLVIESKGLQDQVSRADREVEQFIRERIGAQFPDDGILGEEGEDANLDRPHVWVIDPIDGTACFVNGMHTWCVSVAVMAHGKAVIGAVYDPNADELFHARKGGGAFVNQRAVQVKAAADFTAGVTGAGFSHRSQAAEFAPFLQRLLEAGGMFYRNGSGALMVCYVAAGRLIGYYEPHINSWDCLAGIVIVEAAGGIANDFLANNGLHEGNPILVAGPALYPQLAALAGYK